MRVWLHHTIHQNGFVLASKPQVTLNNNWTIKIRLALSHHGQTCTADEALGAQCEVIHTMCNVHGQLLWGQHLTPFFIGANAPAAPFAPPLPPIPKLYL